MKETAEKTEAMMEHLAPVNEILKKNSYDKARLVPILQQVQAEYKWLSKDIIKYVATSLGLAPASVYGVATFYAHFALEPKGKYVFRLCDGTACHVKGSIKILDALRAKLNLKDKETTTPDMMFTVETVSCLGACGLAPVMVVNEEVHGQLKVEDVAKIVDNIIEAEKNSKQAGA